MAAQYAYVMKDLTKTFPGAPKPVLNDISLQFYQGAKIGIVGPNGVGKSTLIKIMAGVDTEYVGEAWSGENITVGYLPQEPELDDDQDRAWRMSAKVLARPLRRWTASTPSAPRWPIPRRTPTSTRLMAEMGELQEKIDAADGWTLDNQLEIAMEALRCPPGDADVSSACRAARSGAWR